MSLFQKFGFIFSVVLNGVLALLVLIYSSTMYESGFDDGVRFENSRFHMESRKEFDEIKKSFEQQVQMERANCQAEIQTMIMTVCTRI